VRDWLLSHVANDVPLVVLFMILLGTVVFIWRIQKKDAFELANTLRDETGKESMARLCMLWAFWWSSWVVMKDTLRPEGADPTIFFTYCFTWSGAYVFVEVARKWNGSLPWTPKGAP
jgi:cbb3-type cytochrome oxidase subunit 3